MTESMTCRCGLQFSGEPQAVAYGYSTHQCRYHQAEDVSSWGGRTWLVVLFWILLLIGLIWWTTT